MHHKDKEEGNKSYSMYANISTSNKRSSLQFHISSPCAILFHGLAVLIKRYIIFNKGLKHFAIVLLNIAPL